MATAVTDLELYTIDETNDDAMERLREMQANLGDDDWLAKTSLGYLVPRHDDVTAMLRDRRWHSALALIAQFQNFENEEWASRDRRSILSSEGEEHSRLRRLASPAFTPKAANRLRPFMRQTITELVEPLAARGHGEFVSEVCEPYPIPIICELLGAPAVDLERFSAWAVEIFKLFNGNLARDADDIMRAQDELDEYMSALIDERRSDPRNDLLSDMIAVTDDGDSLTDRELLSMAQAVLLAGTDTTRNQLACAVALFAQHPEQYQLLRAQPDLAPQAVEEVMRYLGAIRGTARIASEDIEYRDVLFPAGTVVFTHFVAANRDPSKYTEAGAFDITRKGEAPHMTFGSGIHFCLGAWLARAELQEAFQVIAEQFEKIELDGEIEWKPQTDGIWGPAVLPVRF